MEKKTVIWLKTAAVIILTLLFIRLIDLDENTLQKRQPGGETVRAKEVQILAGEWLEQYKEGKGQDFRIFWEQLEAGKQNPGEDASFSYAQYRMLLDFLAEEAGGEEKNGEFWESLTYKEKYREEFLVTRQDWYQAYQQLLSFGGLEETIWEEQVTILGGVENMVEEKALKEETLLDAQGNQLPYEDPELAKIRFTTVTAYRTDKKLLTLKESSRETVKLSGALLLEAKPGEFFFFYNGYEMKGKASEEMSFETEKGEQIADLYFRDGVLAQAERFDCRISGKLLGVSGDMIELEGYGVCELAQDCIGYRLYEQPKEADISELAVGYDFTDFVLEDGKVRGFLILRKEKMETIRVALHQNNYGGIYHEEILLSCDDCDMTVAYGAYGDRKTRRIARGESFRIEQGSGELEGDRIRIEPEINSARIAVKSLQRSQGTPLYRGKMEILETPDGLVLINEVLLEEYLYSVVPSEMPASYPEEALMAQAVCARTYAYRYLEQPGYGSLGAHVDDSVSYQVYNNIEESGSTTRAVRETAGCLLTYEGEAVSTYYYSTSCGFGSDGSVWSGDNRESVPYLRSAFIASADSAGGKSGCTPQSMQQEESFREYIENTEVAAWEREEPWFRWSYEVKQPDTDRMAQRLMERFQASEDKVLFCKENREEYQEEDFEPEKPQGFDQIRDISCLKRGEGGVLEELLIETDKGAYKVISEYNIRYVLNQGGRVVRRDGSEYESAVLLPSAYLIIDVVKSGKNVIGYTITGGGYGHGVGMSQNGAKAMAQAGRSKEDILTFFYKDCVIEKVY